MWKNRIADFIKKVLKRSDSHLLKNMFVVGVVSLSIKGISLYKEVLIAKDFGVSEILDTFLIAVLIPSFIQNVFIQSYSTVFIPNYILEKSTSRNISAFQASSFIITISIGLLMIGLTYLAIDVYLENLFPGHTSSYYHLVKTQLWIILPCMLFWAISSLISGLLMVDDEFLFSSISSVFNPLAIIICLFFFQTQLQEKTLAIGMLSGSMASALYLATVGTYKKVLKLGLPNFRSENMRIMIKQVPPKISSSLINGLNPIVDQYFSAQMAIGSIAALNYGLKIPTVAIGLISIPIGSVILPHFSKMAVESAMKAAEHLKKLLKSTLFIMTGITLILIVLSKFIVMIFFERGAFTSEDTEIVNSIQQLYMVQIPFYIVGIIMNRYLTAINENNFLVISSAISLVLNIVLNYALIGIMGVKGLALATSLVSLINSLVIFLYIKHLLAKKKHV